MPSGEGEISWVACGPSAERSWLVCRHRRGFLVGMWAGPSAEISPWWPVGSQRRDHLGACGPWAVRRERSSGRQEGDRLRGRWAAIGEISWEAPGRQRRALVAGRSWAICGEFTCVACEISWEPSARRARCGPSAGRSPGWPVGRQLSDLLGCRWAISGEISRGHVGRQRGDLLGGGV